jgi:hypothetical protein
MTPFGPGSRIVMFRGKRKYTDATTSTAMRISRERIVENIVDQTLSGVGDAAHGGLGSAEDGQCPATIVLQLLLQMLQRLEAFDISQAFDPLDTDPLAVQVALEVEEVGLEYAAPVLKRRSRPLVHHAPGVSAAPLDPHGIDAVGWEQLPRRQLAQVDGRHPELAPALLAPSYPAHHPVGAAEHSRGTGQIATGNRPAYPAAGDVLAAEVHRIYHVDGEAEPVSQGSQSVHIATPAASEAMIVPDHQLADGAPREQHLAHEPFRCEPRQVTVEP